MNTVLVVNPRSGLGRTGRRWQEMEAVIRRELPDFEARMTEAPGHATELTRAALRDGAELVVAVGGDGTNNEVINGFFDEQGAPVVAGGCFGFISAGTGSDFERTFRKPASLRASARAIAQATPRPLDVGRATFTAPDGQQGTRFFVNIASFGLSALVVKAVNERSSGGASAYMVNAVRGIFKYDNVPVELKIGEHVHEVPEFTLCAVGNGQYFGGGMQISPNADPSDGKFHVVHVWGWRSIGFLVNYPSVYRGGHLGKRGVEEALATRVEARPLAGDEVWVELDGELPGRLPASFEILPAVLQVRG